jgi:acetoin utilization deacetylase AcuC-like enzyme
VKVVYSAKHLLHNPEVEMEKSTAHSPFEHSGRGEAIREVLAADESMTMVSPIEWGTAPIDAVHNPGLARFLSTAWSDYQRDVGPRREVVPDFFYRTSLREGMRHGMEPEAINGKLGWWCFETTTPLTEGSFEAARGAVDTALSATELVLNGERAAYGLCRPPGHHATSDLYGGYCFFNNAAIAANHVATTTASKVTILDVDYHHGNGTQQIFYSRDDVQYVSLHGDPRRAYPYVTGFADETGTGRGLGSTLNIPLAARTDDDHYLSALATVCESIVAFKPSLLIVSLGLDTFITDPISDLSLTTDGFFRSGALVRSLGIPTVVLQEGGYDINALGFNVQAWLHGLEGIN